MHVNPETTGIGPLQFQAIKQVYETLIAADWFYDSEDTRQDLADLIMRQFRKGHTIPVELLSACEAMALERYSELQPD
jgi:hypothetical protein